MPLVAIKQHWLTTWASPSTDTGAPPIVFDRVIGRVTGLVDQNRYLTIIV